MQQTFYTRWFSDYLDYNVSHFPPAASILALATSENLCALTVKALLISPLARTLSSRLDLPTKPCAFSTSRSITAPCSKLASSTPRLITLYSLRSKLLNPRFGKRLNSGIWPPSKNGRIEEPVRDFCPFLRVHKCDPNRSCRRDLLVFWSL